jgi:hypothetical protein
MSERQDQDTNLNTDFETGVTLDRDKLLRGDRGELDAKVASGELSGEQAADILQAAQRRHVAEHGPDSRPDADHTVTTGGFGSGQGMQKTRTGG